MDPILVGYIAKNAVAPPGGLALPGVDDICSVSTCIAAAPDGHLESWSHNGLCLFDTVEKACRSIAGTANAQKFSVFAFKFLPEAYRAPGTGATNDESGFELAGPRPNCEPLPAGFAFLGYDCVQTDFSRKIAGFGCSPLSCNGLAREIPVNRHCLIDGLNAAKAAARRFAGEQPEPGDYYVVEVWRQQRGTPSP